MRSLRIGVLALMTALLPAACDSRNSETPTLIVVAGDQQDGRVGSLLDRIVDAPFTTAYSGARRMTVHPAQGMSEHRLIFREFVQADGRGTHTIDPIEILEPKMNTREAQQFATLQKSRERFMYEHRDFRIRDLGLFRENYQARVSAEGQRFLDRDTVELEVSRTSRIAPRVYLVDVDVETGLVLRYREFDGRGRALVTVEFESLRVRHALDEALSQDASSASALGGGAIHPSGSRGGRIVLRDGSVSGADDGPADGGGESVPEGAVAVQPADQPTNPTGADPVSADPTSAEHQDPFLLAEARLTQRLLRRPVHPPAGFRLLDRSLIDDPLGGRWMRYVYGDGVEELFFAIEIVPSAKSMVHSLLQEGEEGDVIDAFSATSWNIAQGVLSGTGIVVIGKSSLNELFAMVDSTRLRPAPQDSTGL